MLREEEAMPQHKIPPDGVKRPGPRPLALHLATANLMLLSSFAAWTSARREPSDRQGSGGAAVGHRRSEEHTSELQSLMRISYAVFCLKKKNIHTPKTSTYTKENK